MARPHRVPSRMPVHAWGLHSGYKRRHPAQYLEKKVKNIFVILSGGPGLYDPQDKFSHDASWANFVTPPLLRSRGAVLHDEKTEEVHWLVFEPAYEARWAHDSANRKTAPTQYDHTVGIKREGFGSYLGKIKKRAVERGWKYKGISSHQGFWDHFKGLKGRKVSRVWFYGHAQHDLWLSVTHNENHQAASPDSSAIVKTADIKNLDAFIFPTRITESFPHKFFGCNSQQFASEWAKTLKVYSEGSTGTVDFFKIDHTGGKVTLSSGAKWYQYSKAGFPRLLLSKAGDVVE